MPLKVPDEPKKYTTIYDDFKGVDFTNDPSNVYRRRSPSGLNMLPDLDGRPYKRPGWEVIKTVSDFEDVASGTLSSNQARLHYFSYGDHEYLMIFNDLGVFWMRDTWESDSQDLHIAELESNGTISAFPPQQGLYDTSADSNRAFFFEGNGISGFYVFVGMKLYRFCLDPDEDSNDIPYFREVTPKIPIVLTGCDETGTGTVLDPINMLTDKRTVEYFSDGTTSDWLIPAPQPDSSTITMQVLVNGEWTDNAQSGTYSWSFVSPATIRFGAGKTPPASTVGNIRVTYAPSSTSNYATIPNVMTNTVTLTNRRITTSYRRRTVRKTYKEVVVTYGSGHKETTRTLKKTEVVKTGGWETSGAKSEWGIGELKTPSILHKNTLAVEADWTGSYAAATPTLTWGSYNNSVKVQFKRDDIANGGSQVTKDGSWTKDTAYQTVTSRQKARDFRGGVVYNIVETYVEKQTRTVTKSKSFHARGKYTKYYMTGADSELQRQKNAFSECSKTLNFGNQIYNQAFIAASKTREYVNRVWYSAANDVSYWPDTNYIEVGADDKPVMGMIKVGQYLGVVKKGSGTEASIYLAYATSFDNNTTYAVKQSVSGVGAISNGAFNILSEEPLFLSERGVMGINIGEEDKNKQVRNRSWFINGRLKKEAQADIESAISFVHDGLYYLSVGDHCYVLDGSQKSSWANEKTNLQYECYYLENMPVQCFGQMQDALWFTDDYGNLCRMKRADDGSRFVDDYTTNADWTAGASPVGGQIDVRLLTGNSALEWLLKGHVEDEYETEVYINHEEESPPDEATDRIIVYSGDPQIGETIVHDDLECYTIMEFAYELTETFTGDGETTDFEVDYDIDSITSATVDGVTETPTFSGKVVTFGTAPGDGDEVEIVYQTKDMASADDTNLTHTYAVVQPGVPVHAEWSTFADDDGMIHFFKNLTKKGCVISILPGNESGADVYLKADNNEPKYLGTLGIFDPSDLPSELYPRKKMKKYKRLQIICRNNAYNDEFGIDQIIKTYTVGNYSKNRKRRTT